MDLVPKTIMRFLVITFKESLQNELVSQLYREQVMGELMKETDEVASKRRAFSEMRDLLHRASEILNEVSLQMTHHQQLLNCLLIGCVVIIGERFPTKCLVVILRSKASPNLSSGNVINLLLDLSKCFVTLDR